MQQHSHLFGCVAMLHRRCLLRRGVLRQTLRSRFCRAFRALRLRANPPVFTGFCVLRVFRSRSCLHAFLSARASSSRMRMACCTKMSRLRHDQQMMCCNRRRRKIVPSPQIFYRHVESIRHGHKRVAHSRRVVRRMSRRNHVRHWNHQLIACVDLRIFLQAICHRSQRYPETHPPAQRESANSSASLRESP